VPGPAVELSFTSPITEESKVDEQEERDVHVVDRNKENRLGSTVFLCNYVAPPDALL